MNLFNGFSKTERRIFAGALVIALLCLAVFTSDSLFRTLFGANGKRSTADQIGQIENLNHDVRFKSARTFEWDQANPTQAIHLGDALYAGEKSNAKINLGNGKSVELQPNSLIRFTEVDGQKLSDLQFGNFRVKIDGTMKVAIRGVATTIEGDGAEAELEVTQNAPPKIKVVRGSITATETNKPKATKKKIVAQARPQPIELLEVVPEVRPEPIRSSPVPIELASLVTYHVKLFDLYALSGERLLTNPQPLPKAVATNVELAWETNFPSSVEFEIANEPTFANPQRAQTGKQIFSPKLVYLGANYWRVRASDGPWSKTQTFEATNSFVAGRPEFSQRQIQINLINGAAPLHLEWASEPSSQHPWKGYVLEVSSTPEFIESASNRVFKNSASSDFTFHKTGSRFVRVRAVNDRNELTEFSETMQITIVDPPLLSSPLNLSTHSQLRSDGHSDVAVRWTSNSAAKAYSFELTDLKSQNSIRSGKTQSNQFKADDLPPGSYSVQVASIDVFDRVGLYSQAHRFEVQAPPPPPTPTPHLEVKPITLEMASRNPAAENEAATTEPTPLMPASTLASKLKLESSERMNDSYRESHLQIEGTNTVMVSNIEQGLGRQAPLTGGLALRSIHWFDRTNGAEAALKTKLIGYNETGKTSSPMSLEARFEHRWFSPWTWIAALREIQISAISGIEAYRNSNSNQFASSYTAAKVGLGLEFPVALHWDTGGEVLGGITTDLSKKYEFSGHIHYNFNKRTSFGLGYRVNIFEAASTASSPVGGLPYREAYGEGYTVLRLAY